MGGRGKGAASAAVGLEQEQFQGMSRSSVTLWEWSLPETGGQRTEWPVVIWTTQKDYVTNAKANN